MSMLYILDGHTPVPVADPRVWSAWFTDADLLRRVGTWRYLDLATHEERATVSTVFLAIDHAWLTDGPQLFETMVFMDGHDLDGFQLRYPTWERAAAGHAHTVALVRAALGLPDENRPDEDGKED